ncbi:uncharacterized protein LOC123559464 isoform X2 [Mercenaria mercenaria]|uniref:uncharacterized protein LOC123559464 isoform X2 n=1 Tax=Mercenaria mercenaria TaxID=6596 RepID=UPI001E1DBE92|nr:uncharacterized protein LOC123559464 isoform X2 [Mercenaria mercenaria]
MARPSNQADKAITSCSKAAAWKRVVQAFNARADEPREMTALKKKWDNLVQSHRSQYADYLHSQQLTGGGPSCKKLSVVTEAVMAVIGRNACNTKGVVGSDLDTTQLQINNFNGSISSAVAMEEDELSRPCDSRTTHVSVPDTDVVNTLEEDHTSFRNSASARAIPNQSSSVQVVCCRCNCHRKIEILKEEKLGLQIRLLKKQLGEE